MIADQCSKAWIVTRFDLHDARAVFVNFFHIVHVRNTGVAFGFLSNLDPKWGNPLLVVATLLAIGGVLACLHFPPHRPAFNVADIGITVGVLLLLLDMLFWSKEEESASGPA